MATVKMTFSLDEETAVCLRATAERLARPKSHVVREAIRDFARRADRLSDAEKRKMLGLFDELVPRIPSRPEEEVEAELAAIRSARHGGGRLSGP
ncbi:MAG: hypothetical protein V3S30_01850 [Thermoanaerobaculia bacterium]